MATSYKIQRKITTGVEDIKIDAATLDGKDSSHYLDYNNLTNKPTIPSTSGFLPKTTYEWNKEIGFGSTGKLCIGKFPMYDSNLTVEIKATTSKTYSAILVIATQNVKNTQLGTLTANVYGDPNNDVGKNIYIEHVSGSNMIGVYFSPEAWSKNLIHIQAVALNTNANYGDTATTDICKNVSSIPTTATKQPTNALTSVIPTKTSQLTNDSGFKTTDTDTTYTFANGTNSFTVTPKGGTAQTVTVTPSIANATTSKAGLMSSTDKTNLNTLSNLLGTDSDTVVNKINEVIEIFDSYPEGDKIVDALAGKQSKVAALGSTTKPVYVSADGTFAAASTYAGGTKVTLNGTDKGASTATIYAPTAVGTSGQILKSNGSGAPTWVAQSTLSAGSATKATQDASGNVITSTYATKNETATARNIAAALNSAHVVNADGTLKAKYDGDGNEITATYAKKEYAVYYVAGNTTGTAGTWTGTNSDIKSLYDGLVINYKIGINGADPTTLNINGLGAKTVYLRGTTKVTTQYAVGTMVLLAYNATTGAFYSADYDANSYAYVRQYKTTTNANYPMLFAYETTLPSSYDTKYTRKNSNITANPNTGTINATSFVENGKTLSSKYLPSSGGTINGNLSVGDELTVANGIYAPFGCWLDDGIWLGNNDEVYIGNEIVTPKITAGAYYAPSSSGSSTKTVGSAGQVLMSNGTTSYWGNVSGGGTSSFNSAENMTVDLASQSPMQFDLDYDPYKELIVYINTQDGAYELTDDIGNTISCEERAVMHLNYLSNDGMLLGTMTSDTGVSKPFISSSLRFFAESADSIALNVIIYGR